MLRRRLCGGSADEMPALEAISTSRSIRILPRNYQGRWRLSFLLDRENSVVRVLKDVTLFHLVLRAFKDNNSANIAHVHCCGMYAGATLCLCILIGF